MTTRTLSGLYIYPIKSAAGIAQQSARLTPRGLQYDRRCLVVDPDGRFMTQRRFPRMALIVPELMLAGEPPQMRVSAPGTSPLWLPLEPPPNAIALTVEVWGDRTQAVSFGQGAKAWFSDFLQTPCQLVYMPENAQRPVAHGQFGPHQWVSFADAYPYLLISEASLEGLNDRLKAQSSQPVTMDRFRPNLVIHGCQQPHEEDSWQQVRIGKSRFRVAKPCSRCSVPNVDQATGQRQLEPMKTLATYRAWDRAIWFGQNLIQGLPPHSEPMPPDALGSLQLGDPVEVMAVDR